MTNSEDNVVFRAPVEEFHTSMHRLGECIPRLSTYCIVSDIITQEWYMYYMASFSAKGMVIISSMLIWSWD